jgi:hypothetical protein
MDEFFTPPDPYVLNDTIAPAQASATGLVARSLAINPALRTLVLITAGQSHFCNTQPSLFVPVNTAVIDNFSIYDGAAYNIGGQMLGCTNNVTSATPGNASARVADLLVTNGKFDRVIVVPIAVGGTYVSDWATGYLSPAGSPGGGWA